MNSQMAVRSAFTDSLAMAYPLQPEGTAGTTASLNCVPRRESDRVVARATRLLALTTALSEASTTEQVADVALASGLGVVEATRGFLARVVAHRLVMVAAFGYDAAMRARVMLVNEASPVPLADAARTGEAVWLENVEEYRLRYPWAFGCFGAVSDTQAHVSVPLVHAGEIIGCLGISFLEPTAFGAADRAFTLLLAQVVAAALHRARSYDEEFERRQQAELVAAARAEVLGIVAHDLRNPLSLIDMTAQLLLDVDPPIERRREMLAVTRRATKQMNRLIGDLLDAVRMQVGSLKLETCEADLRAILRQAEDVHRPIAEQRGVKLAVEIPTAPIRAWIDAERILQALGNLLGNALKFTAAGGTVSLSVTETDAEVTLRVVDTGPGIPREEVEHVFDKFWQARNGDRRGVGLGLAIVKGIVDAHHGRAWVESVIGTGSTFALCVPRYGAGSLSPAGGGT